MKVLCLWWLIFTCSSIAFKLLLIYSLWSCGCVNSTGGLKLWECTIDLVEALNEEIKDGQLSFEGKHVLEVWIYVKKLLDFVHSFKEICWRMCLCFLLKGRIWVAVGSSIECLLKTDQPVLLSFLCAVNLFYKSLFLCCCEQLGCGHGLPGILACIKVQSCELYVFNYMWSTCCMRTWLWRISWFVLQASPVKHWGMC